MSGDNLLRVESAVSATASGDLTDGQWPHDVSTALGLAGRRNPLGFAVVRYLADEPSSHAVWDVVLHLATFLVRAGCAEGEARGAAWSAFDFWRDSRCRECHGRGHVGPAMQPCAACGGSGRRRLPDGPPPVREAVSALLCAEQMMEGQLRARLRREAGG